MHILTQNEITQKQQQLKRRGIKEISEMLVFGVDFFSCLFPNSNIKIGNPGKSFKLPANTLLKHKTDQIKAWVSKVLEDGILINTNDEFNDSELSPVFFPSAISTKIIETLLRILTCKGDLSDSDYFFISNVTSAMSLDSCKVYGIIEQVQYESRRDIFQFIKSQLDEEQCDTCAILLLKAIRADNEVHPAEIKYFEIITDLLGNSQARLERIERDFYDFEKYLPITLSDNISQFMFKYLVEIVMCDKQYNSEESQFIQEIGQIFGFDKTRQDEIIQPVASALMVKSEFFQNS
ncbi:TerB family tellurite resistance protein [bacterium]|nr:TerB family tellurite resistance protein [bacterium]